MYKRQDSVLVGEETAEESAVGIEASSVEDGVEGIAEDLRKMLHEDFKLSLIHIW